MDKFNKVPDPPTMLLLASKIRHQAFLVQVSHFDGNGNNRESLVMSKAQWLSGWIS